MSEKSQATRTSKNVFEKSKSNTQYFVREVKDRRMTKNGVEFLIGCRDFPLDKDDTWIDKRNTLNEKNTQTQHERNTATDMDESRADGDDDDEGGNSEDDHGEYEDAAGRPS